MRPDINAVRQAFDRFNALIFRGQLPEVEISVTSARSYHGQLSYQRECLPTGKWRYSDFRLQVSNRFEMETEQFEDTVIHEMIHLFILTNQQQDTSPHGFIFRSLMREINKRFGRNITISHRRTASQTQTDSRPQPRLFCISTWDDGRRYLSFSTSNRQVLAEIERKIRLLPDVVSHRWYVSPHPYFSRYPRSRTLRFFKMAPHDEFDSNPFENLRPLIFQPDFPDNPDGQILLGRPE